MFFSSAYYVEMDEHNIFYIIIICYGLKKFRILH